jgi:cytochrome c553
MAEIGRDRLDLRFGQVMRDRPHDGRCVRFVLVLAPLVVRVCQLPEHVVIELSCQTRKGVAAFGVVPVTGSAWRNIGFRDSFLIDLLAPARGRTIYLEGIPESNIVSCYACHGPNAEGVRDIPRLGGLAYFYLKGRLEQWGQGYHSGIESPMPLVASKLGPNEI